MYPSPGMDQAQMEAQIYAPLPGTKKAHHIMKSQKKSKPSKKPIVPPIKSKNRGEEDDIPLPSSTSETKKEALYLQSFEEKDRDWDFTVPTQYDGAICWNPRSHEMNDMQRAAWDRWHYLKKLEDPRRRYLARYKWTRNVLCTQRFRSPEYERVVPGTCLPKENPWNYKLGAPGMFDRDAVPDQAGALPGDNFVGPFPWNGEYKMNPALLYSTPHIDDNVISGQQAACPQGAVFDPQQNQCVTCPPGSSYDYSTSQCTQTTTPGYNPY